MFLLSKPHINNASPSEKNAFQAWISHLNLHPLHSKQLLVLVPDCFEDENNGLVCSEMKYGWIFREGFFSPFPHDRVVHAAHLNSKWKEKIFTFNVVFPPFFAQLVSNRFQRENYISLTFQPDTVNCIVPVCWFHRAKICTITFSFLNPCTEVTKVN